MAMETEIMNKFQQIYAMLDPRFIGFCDSDEEKQKQGLAGYKVFDLEYLLNSDDTIVISSNRFKDEIKESLLEKGVKKERIFCFLPQMNNYREGEYFDPDFMTFEEEEIFVDAGTYNLETTIKFQKYYN